MTDNSQTAPIPVGRFEWERIVRRVPMRPALKLTALTLATFADADGTRVRPGNLVLASVTRLADSSVRRHLEELSGLGLLLRLSRGGGKGPTAKSAGYRLTVPVDLLERVDLLPPDMVDRSSLRSPGSGVEPVDIPVEEVPTPPTSERNSEPVDSSTPLTGEPNTASTPLTGDSYSAHPSAPTNHDQPLTAPEHIWLSTTVTPPTRDGPVDEAKSDSPTGLCPHGLRIVIRTNGPLCLSCRREQFEVSA